MSNYGLYNNSVKLFLNSYKRKKNDKGEFTEPLTHTWFEEPKGIFTSNIPIEKHEELYDLIYKTTFEEGKKTHVIERFTDPSIFKVDFDFEFDLTLIEDNGYRRQYDMDIVKDIIKIYNGVLIDYLDNVDTSKLVSFVFMRNKGYKSKGIWKDGFHLMYPEILMKARDQHIIRTKILERCGITFSKIPLKTIDYNLVIDKSIIDSNGWMMYGCSKVTALPYLLTKIYDYSMEEVSLDYYNDNRVLIEYLSLYNNKDKYEFKIKASILKNIVKIDKINRFNNKNNKSSNIIRRPINSINKNRIIRSPEELTQTRRLVDLLSDTRATEYEEWSNVGICLFNIDDSLLDAWDNFSKKTIKNNYKPGLCFDKWTKEFKLRDENVLGLGSLHRWAMEDDPIGYEQVRRKSLFNLIENSTNGTSGKVSDVVYEMFRYKFVCYDVKHNKWYNYKGHRWHHDEQGVDLMKRLNNDVLDEYLTANEVYLMKGKESTGEGKQPYLMSAKKLMEVTTKLQDIAFKDKVIRECKVKFSDSTFLEKLDLNPNLIGFENGVYDLDKGEFRDGRPEDLVSLSVGYDYINYNEISDDEGGWKNNEVIKEILLFIKQVLPIRRVRKYFMTLMSSMLYGGNPDERFYIWMGSGANGKTKMVELMSKTLGEYYQSVSIALFTQKRNASSAASPDVAKLRGARMVTTNEPNKGERLNTGLMKEYSGGDLITARPLYGNPYSFKPLFKIHVLSNNNLGVPPDDEGAWRRIRKILFLSKFTDEPDNTKKYQYPIDKYLADKFDYWASAFMFILLEEYKGYRKLGKKTIYEPPEVLEATLNYQRSLDTYQAFLDDHLIKTKSNEDHVMVNDLYPIYRRWYVENYNKTAANIRDFKESIDRKLDKLDNGKGWTNVRFKTEEDEIDNDNNDNNDTSEDTDMNKNIKMNEDDSDDNDNNDNNDTNINGKRTNSNTESKENIEFSDSDTENDEIVENNEDSIELSSDSVVISGKLRKSKKKLTDTDSVEYSDIISRKSRSRKSTKEKINSMRSEDNESKQEDVNSMVSEDSESVDSSLIVKSKKLKKLKI